MIGMAEEKKRRTIEIILPEDIPAEWYEKGFTCTFYFTPTEEKEKEKKVETNVSCEPLETESEDKLVGRTIYRIIRVHGRILGNWSESMPKWLKQCIKSGGLPVFRTRYAGARWGEDMVMAVCYGEEEPPLSGGFFTGVPKEDVEKMEKEAGDWRWIVEKYGDAELKTYIAEKYEPPKIGLVKLIKELVEKRGNKRPEV